MDQWMREEKITYEPNKDCFAYRENRFDSSKRESTLDMTNGITSTIDGFEIRAKEIVDEAYSKVWRLIKKTRWQGHYNTRKRSRRF